jgi:hypothetical protein
MLVMHDIVPATDTVALSEIATCRICAIKLQELCYPRAWWFRPFREVLAAGIRLFALFHPVPPEASEARSPLCRGCLRFRKNAVRQGSPVFRRLDAVLNPLFNRVRASLLTPQEIEHAREFARRAGDPEFHGW